MSLQILQNLSESINYVHETKSIRTLILIKFMDIIIIKTTVPYATLLPGYVKNLGTDVQSVVSLTSSLRVISLTFLADSIYNILIFFAEKM